VIYPNRKIGSIAVKVLITNLFAEERFRRHFTRFFVIFWQVPQLSQPRGSFCRYWSAIAGSSGRGVAELGGYFFPRALCCRKNSCKMALQSSAIIPPITAD
jgi:hypothetical protein